MPLMKTGANRGDKHEIEVTRDRWGRPEFPAPSNPEKLISGQRPSGFGKKITDDFGLKQWALRCVAKGAGLRPDLATMAGTLDISDDKDKLQKIADDMKAAVGGDKGSNTGTAIHTVLEKHLRGEPYDVPPVVAGPVAAMLEQIESAKIEVYDGLIEKFVICEEIPAGGSPDAIVTISCEPLPVVFDLKTGAQDPREFSSPLEYGVQMAIYAHATHSWGGTGTPLVPLPEIDQDTAYVLWVPSDHESGYAELIPLDMRESWRMVELAMEVMDARRQIRKRFVKKCDIPSTLIKSPEMLAAEALIDRLAGIRERLQAIDLPKAEIIARWPEGVPALKPALFDLFAEGDADRMEEFVAVLEMEGAS